MYAQDHTSPQFNAEMNALITSVLELGFLAENQFRLSISAFMVGEPETADQLAHDAEAIDVLKQSIDAACDLLLVLRQPAAVDMRMVVAMIRMASDLERVAKHAQKIAHAATKISDIQRQNLPRLREVNHAADMVLGMVRNALDAFSANDATMAEQLMLLDENVNDEYRSVVRHLVSYMMEDPNVISPAIEIMMVAKSIERVGDYAKNIANLVKYMVHGREQKLT